LTVTFSSPVTNFFLDVYNGLNRPVTYEVADNAGNFDSFTLLPNLSSGTTLVGFPATGSIVTITSVTPPTDEWDFFIDNIHFNEPLPPGLAPEPATVLLLGAGIAAALVRRKRN
jgi:PEP-CTERM motif